MQKSILIGVGLIAIMLAVSPMALAGKGGKGKPGGGGGGGDGDGGSTLPAAELVFLARHAGTNGSNSYEIYSATADQSRMSRLTYDHQFYSGNLAPDPTGTVVMAKELGSQWDPAWGKTVTDLDDGAHTIVIPPYAGTDDGEYYSAGTAYGWTRQRASGALLPYTQQRVLMTKQHRSGDALPSASDALPSDSSGDPYPTENLALVSVDGTGDEWLLSDMTNTWDSTTRIFVHETADAVAYIPEQTRHSRSVVGHLLHPDRAGAVQCRSHQLRDRRRAGGVPRQDAGLEFVAESAHGDRRRSDRPAPLGELRWQFRRALGTR